MAAEIKKDIKKEVPSEEKQVSSSDLCGCLVIDPCGCYVDPCGCFVSEEIGSYETSCGCVNFR